MFLVGTFPGALAGILLPALEVLGALGASYAAAYSFWYFLYIRR